MRYLVDAMNVIGSRPDGWWRDRDGAMARLVADLRREAERTGDSYTVVFERPPRIQLEAGPVETLHAPNPGRDAADDEIVRILEADPDPAAVTVVTSDRRLGERVRELDASVEPAMSLRGRIDAD